MTAPDYAHADAMRPDGVPPDDAHTDGMRPDGVPPDALRQLVREVLRDVLPGLAAGVGAGAAQPVASAFAVPPASSAAPSPAASGAPPSGTPGTSPVASGAPPSGTPAASPSPAGHTAPPAVPAAAPPGGTGAQPVRLATDEELHAFVLHVLALADNPKRRRDLLAGRLRFTLAQGGRADANVADHRVEKGAVTERAVQAAASAGARLVLGRRAVLTPLARDRARALGVPIEKER